MRRTVPANVDYGGGPFHAPRGCCAAIRTHPFLYTSIHLVHWRRAIDGARTVVSESRGGGLEGQHS